MTDDPTVFESINGQYSRGKRSYHTDADCHLLGARHDTLSLSEARRCGMELCSACDPAQPSPDGGSRSTLEAIQAHVVDERGADPFAETRSIPAPEEVDP